LIFAFCNFHFAFPRETGLDFAKARMYENRHARFTAVNPLLASGKSANPQTFNRFVYVGNNPLNRVDPTGLGWYCRGTACRYSEDDKTFRNGDAVDESWKNCVGVSYVQDAADSSGFFVMDPNSRAWIGGIESRDKTLELMRNLYDYSPEKRAFAAGHNRNDDTNIKILTAMAVANGAIAAAPATGAFYAVATGAAPTLT
jgi:RHS repeat-associated protein